MSAAALPQRRAQPALAPSFALSALVHLALLGVMFLGVRFQMHEAPVVNVELWETPAPPAPVVEEKPPPAPKPEPVPEVKKPEIALPEKPKPKRKLDDREFQRQLREQLAREQAAVQERQVKELIAREQLAARNRALAAWTDKIRAKIRGNIRVDVAQAVAGNPEAIFDVTLLPTGEVLTTKMRRSSGNRLYDEEVERAILKASPLPKPEPSSLFQRQLELSFRPKDQ